jgi:hypothetical protein
MVSFSAQAAVLGLSCLPSLVSAAPFKFPLDNGFPNVTSTANLTSIEKAAHGSLPNGAPPKNISSTTLTSLQLIAFNELFEVAYFTDLLHNVTHNVDGYQIEAGSARDLVIETLTAVRAQEELHELNANNAVTHFTGKPILPCEYKFPVDNFQDAIALAATFTDVVLGTLGDVVTLFGEDGDSELITGVASVIGQEGEQNGYYRTLLDKIPSALPFLTSGAREFAFSALNQDFVVGGSCPNSNLIDLPVLGALQVLTNPEEAAKKKQIEFSIDVESANLPSNDSNLWLVYINQQNAPIVAAVEKTQTSNSVVTFQADFPVNSPTVSDGTFGNGLTIAALTTSKGPFASAEDVAKVAIFGPGLIELN